MPALRSASGISMTRKYVKHWHSILMICAGVKGQTVAKFRDGGKVFLSKSDFEQFD